MRIRHTIPALLIGTIAVGACGAATVVAPRLAVSQAAENFADLERFAFTASLAGSDDDTVAFFSEGGDAPTAAERKGMLLVKRSSLHMAVDRGEADNPDDDEMALDVKVGDLADAVQVRSSGKKIYLRGDVGELAGLVGADASDIDGVVAAAAQMGMGFVADAAAGKWITTDLGPLEAFAKGSGSFDAGQLQRMLDALGQAWGNDVGVHRVGTEDAGEHYTVTASARQVYTSVRPLLGDFGLPFGELPEVTEIPDEDYTLDIWVAGKKLNRAELDLTQFVPGHNGGRVALRIELEDRPDGVSVPEDATEVDLMRLFGSFLGGVED